MTAATLQATVLRLPSADAPPVAQKARHGRLPKHIPTLWRARLDRSGLTRVIRLQAQLDMVQDACVKNYAAFKELTEQESCIVKRIAEFLVIHKELDAQRKSLKTQLEQCPA